MKRKSVLRIGVGSILFLLLAVVSWYVFTGPFEKETLTSAEAKQIAEDRFGGDVTDIQLLHGMYAITLYLETGEYQIQISQDSGEVLDIIRTKVETPEKGLTEAEIRQIVGENETGKIKEVNKQVTGKEIVYEVTVQAEQEQIHLSLNGETGAITKREIEKIQPTGSESTEKVSTSQNITTAEAVEIALKTVDGVVDDIDLERKHGQLYYFIEVETKDDLEAEIQIHAITGEVISIEWDD